MLSPDVCVMCFANELFFSVVPLYGGCGRDCLTFFEKEWVCPFNLMMMFQEHYSGFGNNKDKRSLWVYAMLSVTWSIWTEHNNIIFDDQYLPEGLVWDKVVHLVSLRIFANKVFLQIPLSLLERVWKPILF